VTRLLILSASGGAGHVRAGQALEATCRERIPGVEVVHHDALAFCSRPTRLVVSDLYLAVVNKAPGLDRFLYERLDREQSRLTQSLVRRYDRAAYGALERSVLAFDPDHILCTHFLPAHVLVAKRAAPSRRRAAIRASVSVVVTDYDAHAFWIDRGVNRYYVGSDEVRHLLVQRGIPEGRVRVAGIPVHPAFGRERGREAAARAVRVDPERPTVLLMSGGFGVGRVETTLERLLALPERVQLLVVAGRNEALRERLERVAAGSRGRARVFGFVDNIHDHMEASDLAVTKAGGLTVTECLARGLPMVILNPIPGQEEMNADWLVEYGAAVKVRQPDLLPYKLGQLLGDGQRLGTLKRAARRMGRPRAALDILEGELGRGASAPAAR
jgi:processive 1,2-diacylglycerol beta-glucosyltransferase